MASAEPPEHGQQGAAARAVERQSRTLSEGQKCAIGAIGELGLVWEELECSATVFNTLMSRMGDGALASAGWRWEEVLGTGPACTQLLPSPAAAVIVAVPDGSTSTGEPWICDDTADSAPSVATCPVSNASEKQPHTPTIWHAQQVIGNACGTLALLHALLNCTGLPSAPATSWLGRFAAKHRQEAWAAAGVALERDAELASLHAAAVQAAEGGPGSDGSSIASCPEGHHFVTYLPTPGLAAGGLLELDGDVPTPLRHTCTAVDGPHWAVQAAVQCASTRKPHPANPLPAFAVSALALVHATDEG